MARPHRAVHGRPGGLRGDRVRARGHRGPLRDRAVPRRRPLGRRRRRDLGALDARGSRARAAREHRAPDPARAPDRDELRDARAHVPLHRRGARERARGERRVHVDACTLDHRPRAAGRRGARARAARAEAPRARRALPRHREDRDPGADPREGRARSRQTSARSSRRIPILGERILAPIEQLGEVRLIVRCAHEHYDGTGLPRPPRRRADPARVTDRARLRRVPRDDHRPPVPQVAR